MNVSLGRVLDAYGLWGMGKGRSRKCCKNIKADICCMGLRSLCINGLIESSQDAKTRVQSMSICNLFPMSITSTCPR